MASHRGAAALLLIASLLVAVALSEVRPDKTAALRGANVVRRTGTTTKLTEPHDPHGPGYVAGAAEPALVKPECGDDDDEDKPGHNHDHGLEQSGDGTEHPGEPPYPLPNSDESELDQELCSTCEKPKQEPPCDTCEPKSEPELTCNWLLCALIAVPPLLYYYLISSILRPRSGKLSPGPRPLPLVGNLLDLRGGNGNLHHALARLARVHGPVMRLDLGPLTTAVVISSRDDAVREAFVS